MPHSPGRCTVTDRLGQAIATVAGRCRAEPAAIERVEIDAEGAFTMSIHVPHGSRWFTVNGHGCHELLPERDESLPLAADLPRLRDTAKVRLLSWRPRRRIVLRVDQGQSVLVMKGYRARRSQPAALRHALAAGLLAGTRLRVPEFVAHETDREALVVNFVAGAPLEPGGPGQERLFLIGAALRILQGQPVPQPLSVHDADAELAVLDRLSGRFRHAGAELPVGWLDARARLQDHRPPGMAFAAAHRDLHDGQILVTEHGLVLLDFDLLCASDPLLDPANLLAHIKLRELQGQRETNPEVVQQSGRALLDGLDRDAEPDFAPRLRFYQATSFLRLALVHRLRPAWDALAIPLTRLADRCTDELARV